MDDPYDYVYLVHTDHRNSIYFCNECIHEGIPNVRTELNVICVFFSFCIVLFLALLTLLKILSVCLEKICAFPFKLELQVKAQEKKNLEIFFGCLVGACIIQLKVFSRFNCKQPMFFYFRIIFLQNLQKQIQSMQSLFLC